MRVLLGWAAFTLTYAPFDYSFSERGRPFLSLLPDAAVASVVFLVFYALSLGYTVRRRRRVTAGTSDQAQAHNEIEGSQHG